jgi:hypothetical protein
MKTRFLLALTAATLLGPSTGAAQLPNPAKDINKVAQKLQGQESGSVEGALKGIPAQLDALKADQFQKIAQHAKAYQTSATLFGQTATVFLYWPDAKKLNEPVIAVVLPNQFTADKLLGIGSALDIGLNKPAVFWMKNEGTLDRNGMPADLQKHMTSAGMPGAMQADQGFNLFGQLASGFVGDVLKPVNLNANNLFAGAAKGKGGYAVSLSIGANTAWNNPFGLADTKIKGGTVRVTSKDKTKTVEAWGTATLKSKKDYTVYMQKEAGDPGQTIGFDLKSASLTDYFVVLGVVGKTLGLPAFPVPSKLPLDMVTLENPAYQAYTDASAPLNFDSMMFKGKLEKSADGELITNARGKVFGQSVASINLKASKEGVKGAADVNVGLGELKAASAKFYLDVAMTGTPGMGIKADTVLGSLDLKASTDGLALDVPPKCPLQPVGLSATLKDISVKDLPIKFRAEDCATKVVKDIAKGAIEGGKIVSKEVGKAAGSAGNAVVDGGKAVGGAVVDTGKTVGGAVGGAVGGGAKKVCGFLGC